MTVSIAKARKGTRKALQSPRAVIDIGSNTVRLVVYDGPERIAKPMWNEKVAAQLGRDLSKTGRIPDAAMDEAIAALERYVLLIQDLGLERVQTVATAAAREAENGDEFLRRVAALGLEPRLLSGEEEATAAAYGVIGAFPGANGVVADLGGGSLELVGIADGACRNAASLPLGTLRLPALREKQPRGFKRAIHKQFEKAGWAAAHEGPMYMVGGTWRALAGYAMRGEDYPLTDPHGFKLAIGKAHALAKKLARMAPEKLAAIPGINPLRAGFLPDAAAMLGVMLDELEPEGLVFSSWGLREGLLYRQLDPLEQAKDPLMVAVTDFAQRYNANVADAALVSGWSVDMANGSGRDNERLRLAAALMALALHRVEPNWRVASAMDWALDKRWVGMDARGRAMLAAALLGSCGRTDPPAALSRLASDADLHEATAWGLAFRLARRLGATSRVSTISSSLTRKKKKLVLRLDENRAALAGETIRRDLALLADWLGLEPSVKLGKFEED